MLMTCPHCGAAAKLTPNPTAQGAGSEPRYRLTCSGCAGTTVGECTDDADAPADSVADVPSTAAKLTSRARENAKV